MDLVAYLKSSLKSLHKTNGDFGTMCEPQAVTQRVEEQRNKRKAKRCDDMMNKRRISRHVVDDAFLDALDQEMSGKKFYLWLPLFILCETEQNIPFGETKFKCTPRSVVVKQYNIYYFFLLII